MDTKDTRINSKSSGSFKKLAIVSALAFSAFAFSSFSFAQQQTSYTYNDLGLIETVDGPRTDVGDITTYDYDEFGNRTSIINALGHSTTLSDYNGLGLPQKIIDANGVETVLSYHVRGWLESITVVHPSGDETLNSRTYYGYDAVGQVIFVGLPDNSELTYTYDDARRLIAVTNKLGETIDYVVDAAGNRTSETIKDSSGSLRYSMTQAFDELSRVMEVVGAEGQTTHFDYDVNDNNTATTNPRNFTDELTYDPLDRLSGIKDPENGTTNFEYDAQDRLTHVTDANGNTTQYIYDAFDNVLQKISPDTGTTIYTYDDANNRISMVDARGIVTNYRYDALNRLIAVEYPAHPEENISYEYDEAQPNYYSIGRLSKITDNSGFTQYTYDYNGNINSKIVDNGESAQIISYEYNSVSQLVSMSYTSGLILSYGYDESGRLNNITSQRLGESTTTVVDNINYLPFGPVESYVLGNGISRYVDHDTDYRVRNILDNGSNNTVLGLNYSYDANGNITELANDLDISKNQTFAYDPLDRLNEAAGDYGDIDYSYDPVSNRLRKTRNNNGDVYDDIYQYFLGSNQLSSIDQNANGTASTRTFDLDDNGNTIQDQSARTIDYTYNAANRPVEAIIDGVTASYIYNALGQRVSKTIDDGSGTSTTTEYTYDEAGKLISEKITDGSYQRDYIYLYDQLVATVITQSESSAVEGAFYLVNKATGLKLRPSDENDGSAMIVTDASDTSAWVQFTKVVRNDGYFYLKNLQTGKYQRPVSNAVDSIIEQRPTGFSGDRTQWTETVVGDNTVILKNRWTGLHFRPINNTLGGNVVLKPNTWTGNWTQWILEPVASDVVAGTEIYFYHTDHLNTPRLITDEAQATVWQGDYQPFGDVEISTEVVTNNIRFPGQYFDRETGTYYNYFRTYDPSTGRYIQSDPIGLGDGPNTYGYVGGNPIFYYDANGERRTSSRAGGRNNSRKDARREALRRDMQSTRDRLDNMRRDRETKQENVEALVDALEQISNELDNLNNPVFPVICSKYTCPWDPDEVNGSCPEGPQMSPNRAPSNGCLCTEWKVI